METNPIERSDDMVVKEGSKDGLSSPSPPLLRLQENQPQATPNHNQDLATPPTKLLPSQGGIDVALVTPEKGVNDTLYKTDGHVVVEPAQDEKSHLDTVEANIRKQGMIGDVMSDPQVEVTNTSHGENVGDAIVLSRSVLELLHGIDHEEVPTASGGDDDSTSASSLSMIGNIMSRPEVEIVNLSDGDCVQDTIVLSRSVLEMLEGMQHKTSSTVSDTKNEKASIEEHKQAEQQGPKETITPKEQESFAATIAPTSCETASTEELKLAAEEETPNPHNYNMIESRTLERPNETNKHDTSMKTPIPVKCISISASVLKPTKETKTGIWINNRNGKKLAVSKLVKGGLFDSAGLKVGDEILSVNGVNTERLSARAMVSIVSELAGTVTIHARRRVIFDHVAIIDKETLPASKDPSNSKMDMSQPEANLVSPSAMEQSIVGSRVHEKAMSMGAKCASQHGQVTLDRVSSLEEPPYYRRNVNHTSGKNRSLQKRLDDSSDTASVSSGSMQSVAEFLASKDVYCCQLHSDVYYLFCGCDNESDSDGSV